MPKAARLTDIGSGHGCFPPTPIIGGSGDVSINGLKAARKGDGLIPHGCGNCKPHGRSISAGSGTVSINGKPAARVSDAIGCGGSVSSGSGDTSIGDAGMGGALKQCMEGANELASPFVKVDFEAFPVSEEVRKIADFTMAAYAGPDALQGHVTREVQAMMGTKLQSLQSKAFDPALNKLGINTAELTTDTMKSLASGAALQDALVSEVSDTVGGSLSAYLSQAIQPELAQNLVSQAVSAIQGGHITPDALVDSVFSEAQSLPSKETSLGLNIASAAKDVMTNKASLQTAAAALAPSLTQISNHSAKETAAAFSGDFGGSISADGF
ncbi:MAG: PAAR domain-containing protein [Cellvibrionaceae bacterium]|nr:PAAR domain-containing protein [Cellvibrionaceae bacterium]